MARSLTWHCCPWCLTEEEKTAARIDQEINKILLEQKKRDRGELKLLLLGESRAWRAGRGKGAGGKGPGLRGGRTWEPIHQMARLRHREPQVLVQTWVQPSCGASARTEVAPWDGLVGPAPAWQAQHALPALCHGKGAMSSGLPPARASAPAPLPLSPFPTAPQFLSRCHTTSWEGWTPVLQVG